MLLVSRQNLDKYEKLMGVVHTQPNWFLVLSAEPFLESDGSRVRGRGAADRGREEGISAPESYKHVDGKKISIA